MPILRRLIPSMFHRRLALLGGFILLGLVPPALQLTRLTIVRGDELRVAAERRLVVERWLPTHRGRILDRKGRVLAVDRPSFDIAVDYRVISGQWAMTQARRQAYRLHIDEWAQLSKARRAALAERYLPEFEHRLDAMWDDLARLAGLSRDDIDARKDEIKAAVARTAADVLERQLAKRREELAAAGRDPDSVDAADLARPIREQLSFHVILRGVDDATAFAFRRLAPADPADFRTPLRPGTLPGLSVIDSGAREYPYDTIDLALPRDTFPALVRSDQPLPMTVRGVAVHILGSMRSRIFKEDLDRRPRLRPDGSIDRGHYREGDLVGNTGLEASHEGALRGLRGLSVEKLDTGETHTVEPEPGRDLHLTLDIALQARVQALFAPEAGLAVVQAWHKNERLPIGTPLTGAAVVLEVDSGDILALVSTPTFSREEGVADSGRAPAVSVLSGTPQHADLDPAITLPYVNRAVSRPYTPGSIVKPLILCAAISDGVLGADQRIACHGHLFPNNPEAYRCWIFKQFNGNTHSAQFGHDLDASEALMVSCNIFFYELGRRLGLARISAWYAKFGVGDSGPGAERWNLGLDDEYPGTAGPRPGAATSPGDPIFMAIGQGPVDWTPLHAADAYATIARGGMRIVPRISLDASPRAADLGITPRAIALALEGLKKAANERRGTANHISYEVPDGSGGVTKREERTFNIPGVAVWAKSGTADAPDLLADVNNDGVKEPVRTGDHAWVVFLVAPEGSHRPQYAVAVVADYAGSGGRVSGPLANQIIQALIDENYLHPSPD